MSYHYEMRLGASTGVVFMTKKRYDALSPAANKILDENSGEVEEAALPGNTTRRYRQLRSLTS